MHHRLADLPALQCTRVGPVFGRPRLAARSPGLLRRLILLRSNTSTIKTPSVGSLAGSNWFLRMHRRKRESTTRSSTRGRCRITFQTLSSCWNTRCVCHCAWSNASCLETNVRTSSKQALCEARAARSLRACCGTLAPRTLCTACARPSFACVGYSGARRHD
jgi:hypothetical protein